jgi:hypothetical protein
MELILATAVLAASGAALFGLIGQGAMFAGRAQRESFALHLAQSVLDEFLAMPGEVEPEGTFAEDEAWAYRITRESVDQSGSGGIGGGDEGAAGGLTRLVVEVMPANSSGQASREAEDRAACRLVRLVRTSSLVSTTSDGSSVQAADGSSGFGDPATGVVVP